jgi:putative restriction endonuclease
LHDQAGGATRARRWRPLVSQVHGHEAILAIVYCLVLDSARENRYGDLPDEYRFPKQYLSFFEPLRRGAPIFALIYEPRRNGGSMSYVGWARLTSPPEPFGTVDGREWWVVRYAAPFEPFRPSVPRKIGAVPIESVLRGGQVRQNGAAVRVIPEPEVQVILELAFGGRFAPDVSYDIPIAVEEPTLAVRERVERLVMTIERDARFRLSVISAYDGRCAVTGFAVGSVAPRRTMGLLDAAHIRPVAMSGPDAVSNGIAMTPTVHRLFDAGLFTVERGARGLVLLRSSRLDSATLIGPDGRSKISIETGQPLTTPGERAAWPSDEALRFHQSKVFVAS